MSEPAAPIRGLRTMAIVRWILLALVAALTVGTWWRYVLRDEHAHVGEDRFYCPMHPQIRSSEPGTCPICHMNLEPIAAEPQRPEQAREPEHDEPLAPVMLTTERRQRAGIATVPTERISIAGTERWPASVEAREGGCAEVRMRAEGYVERVAIGESNVRVRRGQVLAWVYSPEIVRSQDELRVARGWSDGSVAAAARQRLLLLGMNAADIDAMLASGRSRRTVPVRAPIAGTVTRFDAVLGSYATPDTVLFEITDYSRLRVVATPLGAVDGLREGTTAQFVGGSSEVPLVFDAIEPVVTADTRASRVRFSVVASEDAALRPGQIGEVVVERPTGEALVVPRDAIVDTGTRRYVFVERTAGLFEPRVVEIGALHEESRIVTRGLEPGERVVARGAFVLDSESRLQAALAPSETP